MGTVKDFKASWGAYRRKVMEIAEQYEKTEKTNEKFAGSEFGAAQHAGNIEWRDSQMAAARKAFTESVNAALARMRDNIDKHEQEVIPPSDEQLRLLTTVQLTSRLSLDEYRRYGDFMDGNQLALKALHDLAADRMPDVKLQELKSDADRAREQLRELTRETQTMLAWDGVTSRADALTADLNNKSGVQRGLPTAEGRMFHAAAVAELDPTSPGFIGELLGRSYDERTLALVEE